MSRTAAPALATQEAGNGAAKWPGVAPTGKRDSTRHHVPYIESVAFSTRRP